MSRTHHRLALHAQKRWRTHAAIAASVVCSLLLCAGAAHAQQPPVPPEPAGETSATDAPASPPGPPPEFERETPPPPPAPRFSLPPPLPRARRSTALMVTGIVASGLGVVAVAVGGVLFSDAEQQSCAVVDGSGGGGTLDLREPESACGDRDTQRTAAIGLLIGGGVGIAAGVPLLIVGARKVPITQVGTQLRVGPGGASLAMRF